MDYKEYLPVFIEESKENIQVMTDSLMRLEHQEDREAINELFRATHTLKGMSATMGYAVISDLAHELENYLHQIRSQDLDLTPRLINIFFQAVDEIDRQIKALEETGSCRTRELSWLESLCSPEETAASLEPEPIEQPPEIEPDKEADYEIADFFRITLRLSSDCMLRAARLLTIYRQLARLGELVDPQPTLDDIVSSRVGDTFTCIINCSSAEIQDALNNCMEIEEYQVTMAQASGNPGDLAESEPCLNQDYESPGEPIVAAGYKGKTSPSVRVDTEKLDHLLNLVSELVINKTTIQQAASGFSGLADGVEHLHRLTGDLQTIVMKMRMIPVETVFNRFPRMVRDTARSLNKQVSLSIAGAETELDRTIIEDIADPLLHILRNAIDHGIEAPEIRMRRDKSPEGQISLKAYQTGNQVVIEISDDGEGLDFPKIRQRAVAAGLIAHNAELNERDFASLIFATGLSTSDSVSDISGRGVGLDVARRAIEAMGGSIQVVSRRQQGTTFRILLPLTLAIIQGLLVECAGEIYVIPLSYIRETEVVYRRDLQVVGHQEIVVFRGRVLPVLRLSQIVTSPGQPVSDEMSMVILRHGDREVGILVDDLLGQQEIVIKNVSWGTDFFRSFLGATIMGDGRVVLILDVNTLLAPFREKEGGLVG